MERDVFIMGQKIMSKIKQLGNKADFPNSPSDALLETVINPHNDNSNNENGNLLAAAMPPTYCEMDEWYAGEPLEVVVAYWMTRA